MRCYPPNEIAKLYIKRYFFTLRYLYSLLYVGIRHCQLVCEQLDMFVEHE